MVKRVTLENSNLYMGLIYLGLGPMALLALKLVSDSRFFRKGITVTYPDNFTMPGRTKKASSGEIANSGSLCSTLASDYSYRDALNRALYEEAVLTGRYKLSNSKDEMLDSNNMVCLRNLTKKSLSTFEPLNIVVAGQNQLRECKALLGRPSKSSSVLLLAASLRDLKIVEFDPVEMVIK